MMHGQKNIKLCISEICYEDGRWMELALDSVQWRILVAVSNFLFALTVSAGWNISLNVTLGSCTAQRSRASTFHTLSWAKCDQSSLLLV